MRVSRVSRGGEQRLQRLETARLEALLLRKSLSCIAGSTPAHKKEPTRCCRVRFARSPCPHRSLARFPALRGCCYAGRCCRTSLSSVERPPTSDFPLHLPVTLHESLLRMAPSLSPRRPAAMLFAFSTLLLSLLSALPRAAGSALTTTIEANQRTCFYAAVDKAGEKVCLCELPEAHAS